MVKSIEVFIKCEKTVKIRGVFQRLLLLLMLLVVQNSIAQTISGPSSVCAGGVASYSVTLLVSEISWNIQGSGTIVSGEGTRSISVRWGSTGGTISVIGAKDRWGEIWGSDSHVVHIMAGGRVTIGSNNSLTSETAEALKSEHNDEGNGTVAIESVSNMPVVTVCGGGYSGMLTLSNSLGPILRWEYRHDATNWFPISHTGTTLTFSATQTTYYRAVIGHSSCQLFSESATLFFPNVQYPAVADQKRCGPGQVKFEAFLKDAESYRWYPGQYSSHVLWTTAVYEPSLTESQEFWVSGVIRGCEGPRSRVFGTVNPLPDQPEIGINVKYACEQTVVTVPLVAPVGETYFWQTSNLPLHFNASDAASNAKTLGASGTVYFNAMFNSTGCFSPTESHAVTVYKNAPAPSTPSVIEEGCGSVTLHTDPPDVPRVVNYWQVHPEGTETTNSEATFTVSSSNTYYLRSNFITGGNCWSNATPIRVTLRRTACIESQVETENYVVTHTVQRAGVTDVSRIPYLTTEENHVSVSYSDGLGRVSQEVMLEGSPLKYDVIQHKAYDAIGREPRSYLAYTSAFGGGKFQPGASFLQPRFYLPQYATPGRRATTTAPWEEKRFEASPLGKTIEQGAPGEQWQIGNKTIRHSRSFNLADQVRRWEYDFTTGSCHSSGFYAQGDLIIEEITNENDFKTWNYKDRNGHVVLTRYQVSANEFTLTYSVFDSFSNLRMVIQPEGVKQLQLSGTWNVDEAFIDKWCFTYQYDKFGRATIKKIPGTAPVYYIYNKRNQIILSQDGVQRSRREWTFTKYDELKRVIMTGLYTHPSEISQNDMQQLASAHSGQFEKRVAAETPSAKFGYTFANSFPALSASNPIIHVVNYYDDYNFDNDAASADPTFLSSGMSPDAVPASNVRNKLTGSRIAMLSGTQMLLTVNFYDSRGNLVQVQKDNHLSGKDIVTKRYDFTGKVLEERARHQTSTADVTVRKWMGYDHQGRLLSIRQNVNSDPVVTMVAFTYNELGQVVEKKLHSDDGINFRQTLDMQYTIRGWLSKINDATLSDPNDLFGMEVIYNEPVRLNNSIRQHNGNVSEIVYNDRIVSKQRGYGFAYDGLDRMISSSYRALNALGVSENINGRNEEGLIYDHNGNIQQLTRRAPEGDKLLEYAYAGNKLWSITDLTGGEGTPDNDPKPNGPEESFAPSDQTALHSFGAAAQRVYDVNGNLKADLRRGMTISYNHLNLPELIIIQGKGSIQYRYDALGTRIQKMVTDSTGTTRTRNYVGAYEYDNNTALEFFSTGEGRVVMKAGTREYQYYMKDHLGNVRVTFTATPITVTSIATLETQKSSQEEQDFQQYNKAVKVNHPLFNHTVSTATKYALRLNGTPNERLGLAKSLSVLPGDVVKLEVFAKYMDPDRNNWTSALVNVMNAVATGAAHGGTVVDGGGQGSVDNNFSFGHLLDKSGEGGKAPKAYLNYVVLDRSFKYLDGGFVRISEDAKENGGNTPHEKLADEIRITEPGYVYAFLSNDNETPVEVYFDDFSVQHVHASIVAGEEYYPFGSTFNSFTRENVPTQQYQFNGKERESELDVNWYNYGARMYDPEIARWNGADPLADKYLGISPYAYVANNPLKYRDPNGKEIWISIYPSMEVQYKGGRLYYADGTLYQGDNVFAQTVLGYLNQLSEIAPLLTHRLHALENSKMQHVIVNTANLEKVELDQTQYFENSMFQGNSSSASSEYEQYFRYVGIAQEFPSFVSIPSGSFVKFDMFNSLVKNLSHLPIATLAHELLSHSYQTQQAGADRREIVAETEIWFKGMRGMEHEVQKTMPVQEIDGVNVENIVRGAFGYPLRDEYGRVKIPDNYLMPSGPVTPPARTSPTIQTVPVAPPW